MNVKVIALSCALCLTVFAPSVVSAQESAVNESTSATDAAKPGKRVGNSTNTLKNTRQEAKKELRETIQENRLEMKEEIQEAKQEFKQKLSQIRDTKKQATVQRIDNHFVNVNSNMTDRWTDALEKMTGIVDRVGSEAADLKAGGTDTTSVDAAIVKARAALLAAENAVASQAAKTYTVNVTTDAALKGAVGTTVSQFRQDLRTTHALVVAAKQAVMQTVRALAVAKGGSNKLTGTATPSASPSPVSTTSANTQ